MEAKLTSNQGSTQNMTYFEPMTWVGIGAKIQELRIHPSIRLIRVCS